MSSKTKVIPLLPENSLLVEVEAVEECCLAKCSVENVEVDTNGLTLKRTKKRRYVSHLELLLYAGCSAAKF